jgi:hypothetical protein
MESISLRNSLIKDGVCVGVSVFTLWPMMQEKKLFTFCFTYLLFIFFIFLLSAVLL